MARLMGTAPPNQPEQLWQDFTLKATFCREEVNLVPTLDIVFDAGAYDRYMAIENSPEP